MAVKIRFRRVGARKRPFYKVVIADSRSPRDGRFIEEIGSYDSFLAENNFKVDLKKARRWLACGAQPTRTVKSMLDKVLV